MDNEKWNNSNLVNKSTDNQDLVDGKPENRKLEDRNDENLNNELRLHPISWLFIIIEMIKHFFFPLLVALFAGGTESYQVIGAVFIVPGFMFAFLQYWVYRYALDDNEIVVREGVLVKNVRHVKYERIQNLNLSRNPLHRLFGVAQLELESASGGKPEAVMRVVSMAAVEQIREKVLQSKAAVQQSEAIDANEYRTNDDLKYNHHLSDDSMLGSNAATANTGGFANNQASGSNNTLLKLPLVELVKAGIISNKGMLVVAFAFGLLGQTGALEKFFDSVESKMNVWFDSFQFNFDDPLIISLSIIIGIIAFIVVIRLLSIIFMVFTYYGFELQRNGDKLAAQYGLLTQLNATVPKQRIQLVSIVENVLHRAFNRMAVRIATAGGNVAQQGGGGKTLRWIAPIIATNQLDAFIHAIQPYVSRQVDDWKLVEFSGWKRITRVYASWVTVVILGASFQFGWHALWLTVLYPWIILYARKTVASMRYGLSSNALLFESGWLIKHKTMVPISKIQSIQLDENPFDRRTGMASVSVDVAGLDLNRHHIRIRFLDREVAQSLINDLYYQVSDTIYRWK